MIMITSRVMFWLTMRRRLQVKLGGSMSRIDPQQATVDKLDHAPGLLLKLARNDAYDVHLTYVHPDWG